MCTQVLSSWHYGQKTIADAWHQVMQVNCVCHCVLVIYYCTLCYNVVYCATLWYAGL